MPRELIGPALPPGFRVSDQEEELEEVAGPVLPPGYKCDGSSSDSSDDSDQESISESYKRSSNTSKNKRPKSSKQSLPVVNAESDDDFFGPALPPGFKKQSDSPERPVIGPALPPGFTRDSQGEEGSDCISPSHEKSGESSEDEDIIGPCPASGPVESNVAEEFDRRAWRMKQKLTSKDEEGSKNPTRESWMTELPPELTNFGLGPRTFKKRTNEKSGDRSIWTDTPADKERKAKEKQEAKVSSSTTEEKFPVSDRDKQLSEQVSTYNDSRRSESLIDLHRKKLKRKAEEEKNKPLERRPFDRDQDLQVNRFDEAQKKALLRKSKELNTKFSHGNSSMFL